jgi:hypothetical protein
MTEIDTKYEQLGGASGFLGPPTHEERGCADGVGRCRTYQNGSIYWHPSTGAHETHGSIRAKWAALNWEAGLLGYPTSDERPATAAELDELARLHGTSGADASRSIHRCSDFQRGRVFCWSPDGSRYFTTLITADGQRSDEQHHQQHPHSAPPNMAAEAATAVGVAAVGAAAGYGVGAATGLTAAGAIGSGAGIGAAAGPVGAVLGGIAGLAVYGIWRILRGS